MENENRALSWQQFVESGFDGRDYKYADFEGDVTGVLDCKRWGSKKNLVGYFTLDNGQRIIAVAWAEKNYLGLADIPTKSRVRLTFRNSSTGKTYLKSVILILNEG